MSNPMGTADFFALEAGEYLERLAALVAAPEGPHPDDFVRFARALRGSALMANQPHIARAAAGLEALARAHREGRRVWDPATAEGAAEAIEEFKALVRRTRQWGDAETARAERVARNLETMSGAPLPTTRGAGLAAEPPDLHSGVRAFVAREGALVASALDRAARALRLTPEAREPVQTVIRRMQSLRGLAALSDLTPLPELLDSLELTAGELGRMFAPPPDVAEVFEAAADALTRASRDVADHGTPDPDAPEARRLARLLLEVFVVEADVVTLESLAPANESSIVSRGPRDTAPTVPLRTVDLVSRGENLVLAAAELREAATDAQRDLRLFNLVGVLRPTGTAHGPLEIALELFGRWSVERIASGDAAAAPQQFADALERAGAILRSQTEASDRSAAAQALDALQTALVSEERAVAEPTIEAPPAPEAPPAAVAEQPETPPAEVVPETAEPVIDLLEREILEPEILEPEILEPEESPPIAAASAVAPPPPLQTQPPAEPRVVPIRAPTPPPAPEPPAPTPLERIGEAPYETESADLPGSFVTYARLVRQRRRETPSLDALLGLAVVPEAAAREPDAEEPTRRSGPAAGLPLIFPPGMEPAAPAPEEPTLEEIGVAESESLGEADGIVDIGDLCYRGQAALERAAVLRGELTSRLSRKEDLTELRPLIDELLDLVPLALDATG